MDSLVKALVFLIDALFSIYIILMIIRFLLHWTRSGFHRDALSHTIWQVTDAPLRLLYGFIPPQRRIDVAALVLIFVLTFVKLLLTVSLRLGEVPSILWLLGGSILHLVFLVLNFFFFAILIQAIASWIAPYDNPLTIFLRPITEPLLRPVRRQFPQLILQGGFDLSPLVVLLALQVAIILLSG